MIKYDSLKRIVVKYLTGTTDLKGFAGNVKACAGTRRSSAPTNTKYRFSKSISFGRICYAGTLALLSSSLAFAGTISITPYYEAAGVQSIGPVGEAQLCGVSPTCVIGTENFDALASTGGLFDYVSTFGNNGQITGAFTGSGLIFPADQYGGAGGTGNYLTVQDGQTETVTLNEGVNFFGLWFSALDATNSLSFYQTGNPNPVYTFGASEFQALVGACPGTGFCGNPNTDFLGQNSSQQYAFLNFVSTGGTFNSIVISQGNSGTFEADNETVGYITDPNPIGTAFTPEPGSIVLAFIGSGLLLAGIGLRRFGRKSDFITAA